MQCQVVTAHVTENDGRADVVEHLEIVSYSYTDSEKMCLICHFKTLVQKTWRSFNSFSADYMIWNP